ncbi:hypothetical protein HRR83_002599 [Exophiala dermatitidis]|uniref:Uncharacterized protein n=2 Tax=Exophiala dermatitidis TaxID=5970 RepID=H6BZP6_EXODN|nr:uncharacterized protein HMPREF1120_05150 [Exophiala dermatitidis NIH/UT8656]KAJ4514513.1 hypothetical protein HRR73_005541 [Exophiala dermatitidis]EHY57100.1 hypothetical protein HMPREF1120_05150 [Exophiala dermatitidis NIH/UT8656]KAJ4519902.1 hypothetical protein HRR75_001763 [Exophiala dermatitidis]KAJ4523719.1 hypothetical protein HRR74_001912 [Exophiala dermatitidis]KAJ4537342.1 hypothetical protein HRR76_005353 [Exophiala dermatitidis]
MLREKLWLKVGVSLAFAAALICCTVLSFEVLCNKDDMKAGIITFTFKAPPTQVPLRARGLIPTAVTEAGSVVSNAATAASGAPSQANSIASAAATAVNGAITAIPRNLSIGTKQYCVGFSDHVECHQLPVNISRIVPQVVTNILSDQMEDLDYLRSIFAKATPGWIRDPFIISIATALVIAVVFFTSMFSWPFGAGTLLQDLMLPLMPRLVIGLFCCIAYLLPTIVLYLLYSKSKDLSSEIRADQGPVGGYCWATLFSALLMTGMTTFVHILV